MIGNIRLSSFSRKMVEEDRCGQTELPTIRCKMNFESEINFNFPFKAAPANGIHGPHETRKARYIRQDNNLVALLHDFANRDPLVYLRACAHHLH